MVLFLLKYTSAIILAIAVIVAGFGGYKYAKNVCEKQAAIIDGQAKQQVIDSAKGASDVKKTIQRMPISDVHRRLLANWSRD
jgi:hypothetical protein